MPDSFSTLNASNVALWAAVTALTIHKVFQVREPTVLSILVGCGLFLVAMPASFVLYFHQSISTSIGLTAVASTSFLSVLLLSIAFYRLFLSPLNRFPGPRMAALSKFWYATKAGTGTMPYIMEDLHARYGDIVRTGPNELSVRSAEAIVPLLSRSQMTKGPWFDSVFADRGGNSVHALKTMKPHTQRRRFWDKAMSGPAMQEYLVFIKGRIDILFERLRQECKTEAFHDFRRITNHLTFDIMGLVGFSHNFGMVENGEDHTFVLFTEKAMRALTVVAEIPWIMPLLSLLPIGKEQDDIQNLSKEATLKRFEQGQSQRDMFSYFVQEDGQLYPEMSIADLDAEIRAMIIAGSDTSATTLTFIFEFLSQNPQWMEALRKEVDEHFGGGREIDVKDLPQLPILNAVVNETLRVRPAVPSRSQRIVPAGGITLCGQFIPEGTYVGIPVRLLMRDSRNFAPYPDVWRPERWLNPEDETIFNRTAFLPFSSGPFNCSGKNLGLLQVRYSLVRFMIEFEITAAPQHEPAQFERNIKEYFTVQKGDFPAVLRPRT